MPAIVNHDLEAARQIIKAMDDLEDAMQRLVNLGVSASKIKAITERKLIFKLAQEDAERI